MFLKPDQIIFIAIWSDVDACVHPRVLSHAAACMVLRAGRSSASGSRWRIVLHEFSWRSTRVFGVPLRPTIRSQSISPQLVTHVEWQNYGRLVMHPITNLCRPRRSRLVTRLKMFLDGSGCIRIILWERTRSLL